MAAETAVKVLLCSVICFAMIAEIYGPPWLPSWNTSLAPLGRGVRRGLQAATGLRPKTYASLAFNMCLLYNIYCQTSHLRGPRIYLSRPPLEAVDGVVPWRNQEWLDKLEELKEWHQKPGNHEMTLNELKVKKNSLVEKLKEDTCHEDSTSGNIRCAEALRAFQDIYNNWRGVCNDAFMGWCQPWTSTAGSQSTITYKCSFFIKATRGYAPPLHGYSFKAQDCVDDLGLEIEKFKKSATPEANKAIEPAASSSGRKRRQKKGNTGQIGGHQRRSTSRRS